MTRRAIVVGGGISGLVAARDLAARGWDVTVLESAGHFGGAVASLTIGGVTTDSGAEAVAVARPDALALIDELGLSDAVVHPRRSDARLALAHGLVELPPGVLGIPADPNDPRVAAALTEEERARLAQEPELLATPITMSTTVGELVRARLGDGAFEKLVDPVVAGVHAMSADDADLATLVPGIASLIEQEGGLMAAAARMRGALGPSGTAVASLRGGMHRLTDALIDDCRDRGVALRVNTRVTRIHRSDDDWQVSHVEGDELTADALVLAVPPAQAGALLSEVAPGLAAVLAAVETTPVKVVTLLVESSDLRQAPVGPGVLVSRQRTDVEAKAMTHSSVKWAWWDDVLPPDQHVVRLSYGKAGALPPSDEHLLEQAPQDARLLLGVDDLRVLDSTVTLWADSLVHPTAGHAARMAALRGQIEMMPGVSVLSSALAGNGLAGIVALARSEAQRLSTTDHRTKEMST